MCKFIKSLLFISFLCGFVHSLTAQQTTVPVSDHAGWAHLFNQQNDTTYVINFWATWCAPCVKELPYFEALNEQYVDQALKVILVSLDSKKTIERKLIPFMEKNKIQSEVVVLYQPDANAWIDKIDPSWSGALPATLVYKQQKREFYEQSFESIEELNAIIQEFVNQ